MGLSAGKPYDARHRPDICGPVDGAPAKAGCRWRLVCPCILVLIGALTPDARAEALRIATYSAAFSRNGPGVLLRDLENGDQQTRAAIDIIAQARPDILLLTEFDWDLTGMALFTLRRKLEDKGLPYPYSFVPRPNTGMPTGLDLDADGRLGEPEDAQGYGRFTGDGGMAILSRFPLKAEDFSAALWHDLPGHRAGGLMDPARAAIQRLPTTAHWRVAVASDPPVTLIALAATAPVFDGPEDFNGRRNADEIAFARSLLDVPNPVLAGRVNLDPVDGEGLHGAVRDLLADPRLQDPLPRSDGGAAAQDPDHHGDPALDTADWPDGAPGNLRVDYVLPGAALHVTGSGVLWPATGPLADAARDAGPHRLVWVDIAP